jgi:hypothetical protein
VGAEVKILAVLAMLPFALLVGSALKVLLADRPTRLFLVQVAGCLAAIALAAWGLSVLVR